MKLGELLGSDLSAVVGVDGQALKDVEIAGMSADSRAIKPGFLFAALPGVNVDGAAFVGKAVANGAVAVLAARDAAISGEAGVAIVRAREPRQVLARMAARFHGLQPETAVAVTGTSGKTSVVDFTRQIFNALGLRAASLGTIGVVKPDGATYGSLTTPDPVSLHAALGELAGEGISHLAFEASSHGLDQFRLDGVRLSAGAFTNLGRDHLDYHPTMDAYFAAKMRLFRDLLSPGQPAVINMDGARSEDAAAVAAECGLDVLGVGRNGNLLRLISVEREGFAQRLTLEYRGGRVSVLLPLVGAYQVENALVAAGLAIAAGCDGMAVLAALEKLAGVKGRLEIAGQRNGGLAVIDYAHKPEALSAALDAVRPFVTGRLICVFGCGGDRDKGKRPIMGEIAARLADKVIVTDDNPRSEDSATIRAQILAASQGAREIGDRRQAIRTAVGEMGPGDVVLVAGKGHEAGQIVGDTVLPFSDHEELAAAIAG